MMKTARWVQRGWALGALIVVLSTLWLGGCRTVSIPREGTDVTEAIATAKPSTPRLAEVPPPPVLQELAAYLESYQPQVKILKPSPQQIFDSQEVAVELSVKDYPLFRDEKLGLGPHLTLVLDNEPGRAIYDLSQPVLLEDLAPGTHLL